MSGQYDRSAAKGWVMARAPVDPEAMVVEQYAQRDPVAATRALAAGLSHQTDGAQLTALRMLAEGLVRRNPSLAAEIAADLAAVTGREAAP